MFFSLKKILLFLLILVTLTGNALALEIIIPEKVLVESDQILLSSIADFNEFNLNEETAVKLQKLDFGDSPKIGYQKRISHVLVDLSLQNIGLKKTDYQLVMPKYVTISRKSRVINPAEIKARVEAYLKNNLDYKLANLVIKSTRKLKAIEIADQPYQIKIASSYNLKFSNNSLPIEITQAGKSVKRIYYPFKLGVKEKFWVANHDLAYGSNLEKNDFTFKVKTVFADPADYVKDWEKNNIRQQNLAISLREGDVLSFKDLKKSLAVKWGDKLRLKLKVNSVILTTTVIARGRGGIGDQITVENIKSGYRFKAKIISATEVRMVSN